MRIALTFFAAAAAALIISCAAIQLAAAAQPVTAQAETVEPAAETAEPVSLLIQPENAETAAGTYEEAAPDTGIKAPIFLGVMALASAAASFFLKKN